MQTRRVMTGLHRLEREEERIKDLIECVDMVKDMRLVFGFLRETGLIR